MKPLTHRYDSRVLVGFCLCSESWPRAGKPRRGLHKTDSTVHSSIDNNAWASLLSEGTSDSAKPSDAHASTPRPQGKKVDALTISCQSSVFRKKGNLMKQQYKILPRTWTQKNQYAYEGDHTP